MSRMNRWSAAFAFAAVALAACAKDVAPPTDPTATDMNLARSEWDARSATPGEPFFAFEPLRGSFEGEFLVPPLGFIDPIVNGGFENGFTGWTRSATGFGLNGNLANAWIVGASDPNFPGPGISHNEPLANSGAAGASAIENGSTLHRIFQDVSIFNDGSSQPATLNLWLRWKNYQGSWFRSNPACTSFFDCQDIVIQLRDPVTNALLVELWSAFATQPPLFSGGGNATQANYQSFSFDISAFKGQTVRLQIENRVCCFFQFLDIDDVEMHVPFDNQPPTINMVVDQTSLWPPNHKMHTVVHGIGATDNVDPSPTVTVSVSSDEPDDGLGDGDTANDITVTQESDGTYTVQARAERAGGGDGRTYTITVTATDASGNSATQTATVTVPHSRGK